MDIAQLTLGHLYRVVVAPGLGGPVADVVFGTSGDAARSPEPLSLEAAHHRGTEGTREVRVLATALRDPAPARIPTDVDHRSEGPVVAVRRGLGGSHRRPLLDQLRVERRCESQRDRQHRPVAVDDVPTEDQRDPEARTLPRDLLQAIPVLPRARVEK